MTGETRAERDGSGLTVRRADPDDLDAVVAVCGAALDWSDDDLDAAFFAWKHRDNPFGPSPIWLAETGTDDPGSDGSGSAGSPIVGVRAMMRWDLVGPDRRRRRLTRAVDTATLPSHQGRGIFSRLTRRAVADLTSEGITAVFNTPNDKSRPGYLKLGWEIIGRVPVSVRPRNPAALATMVRSRVPAGKWGLATDVGLDPAEALADPEAVEAAVAAMAVETGWSTPLTVDYLRWRAGFGPLGARIQPLGAGVADGFILFRLRQRGPLVQLSLLHVVTPAVRSPRRAIAELLGETGADVALASGDGRVLDGLLPLPKAGPLLTWRPLAEPGIPARSELGLALGAVELF